METNKNEKSSKVLLVEALRNFFAGSVKAVRYNEIKSEEGEELKDTVSKLNVPIEIPLYSVTKSGDKEKQNNHSLYIFPSNIEDESIPNELKGRAFMIGKKYESLIKLPSGKLVNVPYEDKDRNVVIYGGNKGAYTKETFCVNSPMYVVSMGLNGPKKQETRFVVQANGIKDDWDGEAQKILDVSDSNNSKDLAGYAANLGPVRSTERQKNKAILEALLENYTSRKSKTVKVRKERENLPIFNPSQSKSGVFGCWEFGEQSVAIVEQSKLTPNLQARRLSNIGKNEARKEKYNAKIDAKVSKKSELLRGNENSDENVSRKEQKRQVLRKKLENEISTLENAGIYNRKLRIYAVKKEGENIDYYARFDYKKTPEPEKPEDIENNDNYFKIRKAGFKIISGKISGKYVPVLEVYENRSENGKLSHSRTLSVVGTSANKQLRAFCVAFSAADMAPPTEERAFANAFYSADKEQRLHISDELAKAADEQRNKYFENEKYFKNPKKIKDKGMSEEEKQDQARKYAEAKEVYHSPEAKSARAIEKAGKRGRLWWAQPSYQKTSILKMTRDVLTIGAIAGGIFLAVGSQGHGYTVDAINSRDAREIAEAGGRTYISAQLKTSADEDKNQDENQGEAVPLSDLNSMTNSAEPTLFNYVVENTLDNVVIDTSRPSNMAELFMGENAETYGYDMQTDLQNVKDRGANFAVTNWFGVDYTIDGIKGAYSALGAMAGQEVKEHGVKVDLNNVVYPNSTTDRNSFVKALESLGMTEDEAVGAAKSYTRAFQDAYIASENLVSVEPEEEITYNLADGQLDETLGALLNKDVDIISVNYDNVSNKGIVYALADNGELIKTSFSNGEDYYVEVNNTSGVEAAILDAFDKAEEVENNKDAENDGEVANDKETSGVVKEEEKTSAEDFFKVVEYAPVAKLNLESKKESKLYDYFGETYGNSLGLFYSIKSNKGDDGKAYYSAEFASVGAEDLNITHAGTDVYSTTTQTTTQQKIIYCAIQAISNGECSLGPAPGLHTGEGGKVEEYTVTNHLSNEDKVDARLALIGDGRVMMTTPSATSKDDERVR